MGMTRRATGVAVERVVPSPPLPWLSGSSGLEEHSCNVRGPLPLQAGSLWRVGRRRAGGGGPTAEDWSRGGGQSKRGLGPPRVFCALCSVLGSRAAGTGL